MRSLGEMCVDLAWSQWAALGVSAAAAQTPRHAIDLEALIAFTPALQDLDPRLYEEALDWCVQFAGRLVSVSRLRQVLKPFTPDDERRYGAFATIVNGYGGTHWPDFSVEPAPFRPGQKSRLRPLTTPALVQLRARMIFGINARAEIVTALLFAPGTITASQLVRLGYTRRSLAVTLDELARGGLLEAPMRKGGYQLARRAVLEQLLEPLPDSAPPWPARFAAVARLLELDRRTAEKSTNIRSIELRKALEPLRPIMASVNEPIPVIPPGQDPWPPILAWLTPLFEP